MIRPGATSHGRAASRQAGWASAWRLGPAEEVARDAGTGPTRRARSLHGHHVQFTRPVARSSVAHWWLAYDKVLPVSSWGPQGGRWARQSGAELTRTAVQRGGGGEVSGQQRSLAGRELWWPVAMEEWPCSVGAEEER
jgi:hypothetical protein